MYFCNIHTVEVHHLLIMMIFLACLLTNGGILLDPTSNTKNCPVIGDETFKYTKILTIIEKITKQKYTKKRSEHYVDK